MLLPLVDVEVQDRDATGAEVLDGMQRAHGEIVEHTVSRAEGPVGMMGAACHVPGEASGTPHSPLRPQRHP